MITGKHVRLRSIERSDLPDLLALNNDPVVRANVVGWAPYNSMADQERWFETLRSSSATQRWVVLDGEDRILGLTGLWDLDRQNRNALTALKLGGNHEVRGRGLGTDAIKTVMAVAFYEFGLNRLYGSILMNNAPSMRAYVDKCGWSVEGTSRQAVWRHGRFLDLVQVGVLRDDFDRLDDATEYIDLVTAGSVSG